METQKNIVCGADIHKKFIIATILSRDETKIGGRFGMTLDEIVRFKEWIVSNNCEAVAIESTGDLLLPLTSQHWNKCWPGCEVGNKYIFDQYENIIRLPKY